MHLIQLDRDHIAGPLGNAADSANAFKGIDSTLLYATLAVVIVVVSWSLALHTPFTPTSFE